MGRCRALSVTRYQWIVSDKANSGLTMKGTCYRSERERTRGSRDPQPVQPAAGRLRTLGARVHQV
jgi:hypothetical protein